MKIIVDADACPRSALDICMELGRKHAVPVWTVASFNHCVESDNHIVVGDSPQETDYKVMNLTEAGDVVVTQDWGLAAAVMGKRARCMSPGGREYSSDTIEFLLEEREVKAKLRRMGGRTKGPRKRAAADDHHFEMCLKKILQRPSGD